MHSIRVPALLLAACALLSACGRQDPARPKLPAELAKTLGPGGGVNAGGETPLWTLQVRPGMLQFSLEDAPPRAARITAFTPEAQGAATWSGGAPNRAMRITVAPKPCSDAATGLSYPLSATAQIDGRTYRGCAARPGQGLGPRH